MMPSEDTTDGWNLYAVHASGRDRLNARTLEDALAEVKAIKHLRPPLTRAIVRISKETLWQQS